MRIDGVCVSSHRFLLPLKKKSITFAAKVQNQKIEYYGINQDYRSIDLGR